MMTKPVIQEPGNWSHEDAQNELKESDESAHKVCNWNLMWACAVSLRYHLSEYQDTEC